MWRCRSARIQAEQLMQCLAILHQGPGLGVVVAGTFDQDQALGLARRIEQPLTQPAPGMVLLCCSQPLGRVVLDI